MKKILQFLTITLLAVSSSNAVVACNNSNGDNEKKDISSGVVMDDLHTAAKTNETYAELNHNTTILETVEAAIEHAKNMDKDSITPEWDFILVNDQTPTVYESPGTKVTFIVKAITNNFDTASPVTNIMGNFQFTDTLVKADISEGVTVNDQSMPYVVNYTYFSLNTNATFINAVINAIKNSKNITTANGTDFYLRNNQVSSNFIKKGDVIYMIVLSKGSQISGGFSFKVIIT